MKNFDPNWLVVPIVMTASAIMTSFILRKPLNPHLDKSNLPSYYKPSLIVGRIILIVGIIIALIFLSFHFFRPNPNFESLIVFGFFASMPLILAFLTFKQFSTHYIFINDEVVEYHKGKKVKRILRKDIHFAYASNGYIFLMLAPKKVGIKIPLIFKNSGELLARLQNKI